MLASHIFVHGDDFEGLDDAEGILNGWEVIPSKADNVVVLCKAADSADELQRERSQIRELLPTEPLAVTVTGANSLNLIGGQRGLEFYKAWLEKHPHYDPSAAVPLVDMGDDSGEQTGKEPDSDRDAESADEGDAIQEASKGAKKAAAKIMEKGSSTKKGGSTKPGDASGAGFASLDNLWPALDANKRTEFAGTYVAQLIANRNLHDRTQAYRAAPDVVLLAAMDATQSDDAEAKRLRMQLLRARAGIRDAEDQQIARDQAKVETDLLREVVNGMQKWRDLANRAPAFLVATLTAHRRFGWVSRPAARIIRSR